MENVAVIIPTYNAKNSIVNSINGIKADIPKVTIFVVDDSSPDGTSGIVQTTFKNDKKVTLLKRKGKGGRGSAVIAGFREALKNKDLKFFIEMDADLCHNPRYIIDLVNTCRKVDIVIASKYHQDSTITGLKFKRKIMSRIMNIAARMILQVPITDYTNGYRCYNRKTVEFIVDQKFTSSGFVVLSEIVYRCYKRGFTFAEIPFDFRQVSVEVSNFNYKEVKEAILTLLCLKFEK